MLARNVSNYNFQKCRRRMLAIIIFKNAGDKCYQLEIPEMLATTVSKYSVKKCWRDMLAIIISRNAGEKC